MMHGAQTGCITYKLLSPCFSQLVRPNSALAYARVSLTWAFAYLRARLSMLYYQGLCAKLVFTVQSCY